VARPRGSKRAGERVARWFELPADVIAGVPRVTLLGETEARVGNHRGLIAYSPRLVVIALESGELRVAGSDLVIARICREEVVIAGKIRAVARAR